MTVYHLAILLSGEDNGTPLQYSCLENPTDGGAWWAAVYGVAQSQTRLSDFTFTFHFHALEKEMATHSSSCLQNPRDGEPGGLPSMGLHRVGHDWSNLPAAAAAAAAYSFLNFELSVVPCKVLTVASWSTYRFLRSAKSHVLGHKTTLSKFKKIETISSIFSDHKTVRVGINYRKKKKLQKNT